MAQDEEGGLLVTKAPKPTKKPGKGKGSGATKSPAKGKGTTKQPATKKPTKPPTTEFNGPVYYNPQQLVYNNEYGYVPAGYVENIIIKAYQERLEEFEANHPQKLYQPPHNHYEKHRHYHR